MATNDSKHAISLEVQLADLKAQLRNAETIVRDSFGGGKVKIQPFNVPTDAEWATFQQKVQQQVHRSEQFKRDQIEKTARIQQQLDDAAAQKAKRQSGYQNIQLAAQLQDFGLQVAGGQNPLLALAQQGSQLSFVYGGVGNALKAVGGVIATAVTSPITLAAAALGVFAYSAYRSDAALGEMNKAIALTGKEARFTSESLEGIIRTQEKMSKYSGSGIRDVVVGLAGTGRFNSGEIESLTEPILNFSKITGQAREQVVKNFAAMKDSPSDFGRQMLLTYGGITSKQLENIEKLEASGDRIKASSELQILAIKRFGKDLEVEISRWDSFTQKSWKVWDSFWDAVLGRKVETAQEKIDTISKKMKARAESLALYGQSLSSDPIYKGMADEKALLIGSLVAKLGKESFEQASKETQERLYQEASLEKRLRGHTESLEAEQRSTALAKQNAPLQREITELKRQQSIVAEDALKDNLGYVIADKERIIALREITKLESDLKAVRDGDTPEQKMEAEKKRLGIQRQIIEARNKLPAGGGDLFDADAAKSANETIKKDLADRKENNKAAMTMAENLRDQTIAIGVNMIGNADERARKEFEIEAAKYGRITSLANANAEDKKAAEQAYVDWYMAKQKQMADELEKRTNANRGMNEALREYYEELQNKGKQAEESTRKILGSIEDTLMEFVKNGKLNVKSLVDTMIAEFYRLQIVKPLMASLTGGGGGGGFFEGLLGTIISGSIGGGGSSAYSLGTGSSGQGLKISAFPRASGGETMPNSLYRVAERGPELYRDTGGSMFLKTGSQKGSVSPNVAASPNIYINIDSATDRAQVSRLVMQGVQAGIATYHGQVQRGMV
jgi:phage-related minor tail protein